MDVLHVGGLDVDAGDDGALIVVVRRSRVTDGTGGGVGEGGSIRAWAASYRFFALALAATMASSFF
jgi:hypothetical protein